MRRMGLLPVLLLLPALSVFAQNPNYGGGFTSGDPALALNGYGQAAAISGTRLRLTDGGGSEGRTAFFNTPVNVQSFTNNFTFQLTNASADGFTFTIQGVGPTALGARGGGLAYTGIGNSIAVGFQLYSSALGFQEVSLTGDWTNGAAPDKTPGTDTTGSGVNLHSGDVMSVHMTYDGTTLTWTITDTATGKTFTKSVAINIPALTGNTAYVGFTGGDGGLTAVQDILTWTYTPSSNSPVPPSITTQPSSQTVATGQTATFSVVASGTNPLSYQWQQNAGSGITNIAQANSSSYTTPPTNGSNQGNTFDVIVSNSAGSVTSSTATLTVTSSGPGINFGSGFASSGSTLVLNGYGQAAAISGTRLRLTDGGGSEGRTAFFNTPVNVQSFVNDFSFQLTNANADGFTFTMQGVGPTALGARGGGLAYTGIGNSIAVGFQLYSSALGFQEVSLTGDWTNGAAPDKTPGTDTTGSGVNLHSGDVMSVHMTYDGTTLTWTITDTATGKTFTKSVAINIPALTGNTAYVGFTGGDGGLTAVQDILTWTYTPGSGSPAQVATPTFNPPAGTYSSTQSVAISDTTSGATIYYTTDGSTPTTSSTKYTGPISVSTTTTIEAMATASGMTNSSVGMAAYTIQSEGGGQVATPSFNPPAGTYSSTQSVAISDTTSGATIYYTTDGSTPTTSSTKYTGPISVSTTTTIEAIAAASGMTNSSVGTAAYTIQSGGGGSPSYGSGMTATGITMNNGAAISGSARLRLTDGNGSEKRSAFFSTPVNVQSFVSTFTFQLTNPNADGFTFTIQNNNGASTTELGSSGGGLGYAGIPNSVAVGFQLYSAGSEVSLMGFWKNGQSPDSAPGSDMSGASINLHNGDIFKVIISYDGTMKTLSAYIKDISANADWHLFKSFSIDIPATMGNSNTAYVGFTGGEGGLTAIQDILSWSYTSSATGTSGTFIWPVDPPAVVGAHDYSSTAFGGQYHTGIDLCPGTAGCQTGDPVYASADGTVQAVFVTSDPAQTMCDGSSTGSLPHDDNHLGNTVIVAHSNGKYSLYGNMDCVWPGIVPGAPISQHARIGNIGNSQYGVRVNTWTPHMHFEIKDTPVVTDPATGNFASFTPDLPDGYGFHDPRLYLFPFSQSSVSPTAVKVVSSPFLNVLTGPDTSYSSLGFVTTGQEFVAYGSSGSWYQVYLPNSEGPISGWIPASAGSLALAAPDSAATKIQVTGSGSGGLLIRPGASAATNLVSWDNNSAFTPNPIPECTSTAAKIWDGQYFVTIANQNGFDEFYLPLNYYFSSGNSCTQPSSPGPAMGWASQTFLK